MYTMLDVKAPSPKQVKTLSTSIARLPEGDFSAAIEEDMG